MFTIVVVPGACHVLEHFSAFAKCARAWEIEVNVVELPSASGRYTDHDFDLDVTQISQQLDSLLGMNRNVLLVAHSYGALPACEAIAALGPRQQGRIIGLMFVCAFVPQIGMSLLDLRYGRASGVFTFDGIRCWVKNGSESLFNAAPQSLKSALVRLLVPHNAAVFGAPTMSEAWKLYPCSYVKCGKDRALVPAEQDENVNRLKDKKVFELFDSDHFPFGSCPEELMMTIVNEYDK